MFRIKCARESCLQNRNFRSLLLLPLALLFFDKSSGISIEADTAKHSPTADVDSSTNISTANGVPRSLRLPNTTYPLHYYLHIISNIHREEFEYVGNVTIEIAIRESTNEIVLHAKNLSDFAISMLELHTHEKLDDLTYTYDPHASFLIIHPIENYQAFEAGQHYRLEILFKGLMHEDTFGIYWMIYSDQKNNTVYVTATQFEPTSARLAFPCYDEPSFKANFTISLTHSNYYTAISNMMVRQIEPNIDANAALDDNDTSMVTTTFHTTPAISTYLVAFVISDFVYISEEYRGVVQRIFTSPRIADKGRKALKNAVHTVAMLEDYFGIDYPLAKLDHIALKKNFGSAMENWGLITYKEDNLVQRDGADLHKKLKDILTQNHEIAHQWFGNLVSPQWWTYAWLNEGFATYFGYVITDLLYPEYKTMDFFLTDIAERAYSYNYMTVRPMTYYVEKESEIISVFDIISYQRAACVIKMFHHAFNQKTFVRGVSNYLRKYQFTVANELDLFDAVQSAVAEDPTFSQVAWSQHSVRSIMLSWTHSEWIPIVSISRDYEQNTITIRQRSKDQNSREHWWIPLNFASASAPNFERTSVDYFMPPVAEVTLNASDLGIELRLDDWLIVNKQQTGFYHVLYNDANLWLLAKQLHDNHTLIHPLNRAAIFQDLGPLIENNEIQSVDVIFELLQYLQYEENLIPWNQVADTIVFLSKNLFGTLSHKMYHHFVRELIRPMFKRLFEMPLNENLTNTELLARQKIMEMACLVDLKECLDYTHNLAHEYIFGSVKLDNDMNYYAMYETILCLGVKYLSDKEFNDILDLFAKAERETLWYDDLIYSLRCTQSQTHLRQYLNLLLGENSTKSIMNDSESMMYLFYLFKSNLAARPVMWEFFESNYRVLCRSQMFVENFNRIAEYMTRLYHSQFLDLRNKIDIELQKVGREKSIIAADSIRIGKKVKISETFLEKFNNQIYEWLKRRQQSTYAASLGVRSSAAQIGHMFRVAGKFLRNVLIKKG
ncbi:aminopeptidase N [Anastrepha obliqua]|uniref:aminopeptidase N n=1 Tax=Anastrepha obliqua TaxID=95512 RepID=UPI00240A6C07|nr:aminopeptidase N [Anastrepha obliqua]